MTDAPVIQTAQVLSERYGPAYRWLVTVTGMIGVVSMVRRVPYCGHPLQPRGTAPSATAYTGAAPFIRSGRSSRSARACA